jgi:tRNA A-37 threonylcarbamoyl transferase component Bud32
MKINLSALNNKIEKYVKEYYSLKTKPILEELPRDMLWLRSLIERHVEYTIINFELKDQKRIEVSERMEGWDHKDTHIMCIAKKGYELEKKLGEYSWTGKYLLKGNKTAKLKTIYMWNYKQKNEMKSVIMNEFKICKKAESLGIGPKTYDTFICFNKETNFAYKVVVSEYINGQSLAEWLKTGPSVGERERIYKLVKSKIDKMHGNGIIHSSLSSSNVILKQVKGKVVDVYITDFVNSYDVQDKSMWDYNKWIQGDRDVLNRIMNNTYSFANSDDVVNYVASKLRTVITLV